MFTCTTAHNIIPSHLFLGGANYAASFCSTLNDAEIEVCKLIHSADRDTHSRTARLHFVAAVLIACEAAGVVSSTDTNDMLDYIGSLLAA